MARRSKSPAPSASPAAPAPLALPGELTIYTVGELHPQWCAWLAEAAAADAPAAVQAEAVDQVDAAGVQLLLSLQRGLAAHGRTLQLHVPSTVLRQGCAALGLGEWLQEHQAAEGAAA